MPIKSICSGEISEAGLGCFCVIMILLACFFPPGLGILVASTMSPISISSGAIGSPTTLLDELGAAPSSGATLLGDY
jgi:hypothetical protein